MNYDVIIIFLIYGKCGAIRKLYSGHMVSNFYIFNNSNLLKRKLKASKKALILLLWVKVLFCKNKMQTFCKRNADASSFKRSLVIWCFLKHQITSRICRRIVWMRLTVLWGWRLKYQILNFKSLFLVLDRGRYFCNTTRHIAKWTPKMTAQIRIK